MSTNAQILIKVFPFNHELQARVISMSIRTDERVAVVMGRGADVEDAIRDAIRKGHKKYGFPMWFLEQWANEADIQDLLFDD